MDIKDLNKVADCIIKDLTEGNIIYTCEYDTRCFMLALAKLAKMDSTFAEKVVKLFNHEAGLQDYDRI